MSHFVQLHAHSYYSLLEGLIPPERLVKRAAEQGALALALTDHVHLCGAVDFTRACLQAGIQPILGMEVDVDLPAELARFAPPATRGPLVLLAHSLEGWQNLCRLSSILLDQPAAEDHPALPLSVLHDHNQGLYCLTGGRRSLIARFVGDDLPDAALQWLYEVQPLFPGRFYVELQNQAPPDARLLPLLADLAARAGVPLVASADIFYERPDQHDLHHLVTAIRANRPLAQTNRLVTSGASFPTNTEMQQRLNGYETALENSAQIAAACAFTLPFGRMQFPAVSLPPGLTNAQHLRRLAQEGARRRYGKIPPEAQTRLEHELGAIASLGFEPIFLVMEEIMRFARSAGIPVSSRGSAASSLVAHCLGITNPDPLALNLYFERFLNPSRATPPDIDTDICSRRRDQVLQHVFDTYGADHVAMVGTINRFRPRSALWDTAKAHGFTPTEIRHLAARMPYRFYYPESAEEDDSGDDSPFKELEQAFPQPRYRAVFQQAKALLGLPRHLSIHPGGIVITPGPVTDLIPVQRAAKGFTITQFDHKMLEPLGIIKLDLLGIRGLTVLGDVAESIHSWQRSEYATPAEVLEAIPSDDAETCDCIENGQTIGCFQIESPGMRATLKEIHARSVQDLVVALALYRPGPLTGGLKDAFVRRHNHQEAVSHIHPALAPLLGDTYGVILYQEQVLRIAHELAGFSLSESDLLRRAMSHFDPGRQMITLKQKFLRGAAERHNVAADTAEKIWELMAAFAGYGFPKAHAASYGQVAWQSAWCKTHFPAEFMAAVMANWGGYYSQRVYLMEARHLGLTVRPPHINHAQREFSVAYPGGAPVLYMGLDQVRNLTRRTQQRTLAGRPFTSLQDYLARVDPRREEINNLIRCCALEGLGSIPALLRQLEANFHHHGQLSLFGEPDRDDEDADWSAQEKGAGQADVLGVSVDFHPLERVAAQMQAAGAISSVEAAGRAGQKVRVAGVRQISHRSRTATGSVTRYLSFEDLEGVLDVVILPEVYRRFRALLVLNEPLLIEGIIENEPGRDEPVLRAEKIYRFE